jgi:hypothetical protein
MSMTPRQYRSLRRIVTGKLFREVNFARTSALAEKKGRWR